MMLNNVVICIATFIASCVTHFNVQNFIEHCVRVITIFNSLLLEVLQRRKEHKEGAKFAGRIFASFAPDSYREMISDKDVQESPSTIARRTHSL